MNSMGLIEASLLLAMFVLLAGGYGLFYSLGRLHDNPAWIKAGYVCYGLQWVVTLAILAASPLASGWKLLIVASCLACFKIPHVTWSYLELTHQHPE